MEHPEAIPRITEDAVGLEGTHCRREPEFRVGWRSGRWWNGYVTRDNRFFATMAVFCFGVVFIGFARTYYLAGLFKAPLPNLLVHIHGAVFSLWILLFATQTSLVAARRPDLHRRLGMFGFLVAFPI